MQGKTLRVSYPGDSGTGYTLTTRDDNGQKTGSVVAFMNEIAAEGDFRYELHNVSEASTIQAYELACPPGGPGSPPPPPDCEGSSWTACVHEVALGETE